MLETVYSVEEDGDTENNSNQEAPELADNSDCDGGRRCKPSGPGKGRLQELYGSFERLAQENESPPNERPKDESQQAQVLCFSKIFQPNKLQFPENSLQRVSQLTDNGTSSSRV